MANRNFKRVQGLDNELKIIAGYFTGSGSTAVKQAGTGWNVERTATGVYTITLEDRYPSLISAQASYGGPTMVYDYNAILIASYDVAVTGTIVLDHYVEIATKQDLDGDIHIAFFLKNSTSE